VDEKILVVDDQPVNVELIAGYLEKDYEIIPAYSGEEALAKVKSEKPDIVLLDIMMPGVSGYEVCERIKKENRFIPVVIVTALGEVEDRIRALEAGADDFLTKPIDGIELATRVKSLLKAKYFHDRLVKSKEQIEAQNDFKTIMANLLPFLLENIPPDKRTEIIMQMSKQVEEVVWEKYIHEPPADLPQATKISTDIMNLLGGEFSLERVSEKTSTVTNKKCPWGDYGSINPVLCMLTRAIFTRTAISVSRNINVEVTKTIAAGDGHCLVEVYLREF
jgi:DNA-binding response OmpR family regulator